MLDHVMMDFTLHGIVLCIDLAPRSSAGRNHNTSTLIELPCQCTH